MIKSEELCKNVDSSIRPQVVTLSNAVLAMQKKIEKHTPELSSMPLTQEVVVNTGETVIRANPAIQEFRALVRDYTTALKALRDIVGEKNESEDGSSLDSLRKKFKVG